MYVTKLVLLTTGVVEKLTFAYVVKKFMKPEVSFPYSQERTTAFYPEPD